MDYFPDPRRYDSMAYRRAGRSGLKLPTISLGLWQNFGDERPIETQRAILRRAFDLGIIHFDLANNYGPPEGSAETNFGRIFAEDFRGLRDEIIISTKVGYFMQPGPYGEWGSRKSLLAYLDQSLHKLRVDYVDIFYSHRWDPETPVEETMGALASAVHRGKALYAGVSNYTPEQTHRAAEALKAHNVPLVIHQPIYSMFNRNNVEAGLLPVLDEIGAGCIVFSPLAGGLLTDRYLNGAVPTDSRAATNQFFARRIDDEYLERARALNNIAAQRGQTLAQLALTWVLRHRQVTSALVGASSVAQLEQNVAALAAPPLSAEELAAIEPFAVDRTRA